jgi:hypothetical protein
MKKNNINLYIILFLSILSGTSFFAACKKTEDPIRFPKGTFPDTVLNLQEFNSPYDDYNVALYQLTGSSPIIFSSNRRSSGGQFDLEQGGLAFTFDQTNGSFEMEASMLNNTFLDKLILRAQSAGNDFGPYRFFSSVDGFEYMVLSSVSTQGNLDLYYVRNRPIYGSILPDIEGPNPVKLLNTTSDDAYFCLDTNQDSAYFTSDRNGNFDIFVHTRPAEMEISTWFNKEYSNSMLVDSVSGSGNDKCPMVFRKVMVFASDRPGGLGGYDLYYSLFKKGKWGTPVNLGPGINTASDEYRPVIGYHPDFTNYFMMFSSSRSGGKGGFDLYFTGIEFPGE